MARLRDALRGDSKYLSLLLRHNPGLIGLQLDPNGWARIDELVERSGHAGRPLTRETIGEIVRDNDKRRFSISEDGERIRANQGHTIAVDLDLPYAVPPDTLYYSTAPERLDRLLERGIRSGVRPYVQLRPLAHGTLNIGARRRGSLVLEMDAARMHREGRRFRRTDNEIWLTERVDPDSILRWTRY